MDITILLSDLGHPIRPYLDEWIRRQSDEHVVHLCDKVSAADGGDLLILVSCNEVVRKVTRNLFSKSVVLHASDLPRGKGWSPHIWAIVNGARVITVSMIDAADSVDSGAIWKQVQIEIPAHFIWHEINHALFSAELQLMDFCVENFNGVVPRKQSVESESYFRKRTPEDSELDPNKSLLEQFDLIRCCDPNRFPAYFQAFDHKFEVTIKKVKI